MLRTIVHQSSKLAVYLLAVQLALLQPQMDHLTRVVAALIVCDSRKLLTVLYRQFVNQPDPKTAADFFRESPWRPGGHPLAPPAVHCRRDDQVGP